jgi:hypothetical protein
MQKEGSGHENEQAGHWGGLNGDQDEGTQAGVQRHQNCSCKSYKEMQEHHRNDARTWLYCRPQRGHVMKAVDTEVRTTVRN